jgi:hypothetical protein
MKTKSTLTAPLVAAVVLTLCQYQVCPAGEGRDDDYYRQRDELIAQEKDLLRREDETASQVFELKRTINTLYTQLSAAQDRQDAIRHRLTSIQMKLMQ